MVRKTLYGLKVHRFEINELLHKKYKIAKGAEEIHTILIVKKTPTQLKIKN